MLIYGETGTGKELPARALHMESPRRKGEKDDIYKKITSTAGLADSQVDDALIRRLPEQGVTLRTWSAN